MLSETHCNRFVLTRALIDHDALSQYLHNKEHPKYLDSQIIRNCALVFTIGCMRSKKFIWFLSIINKCIFEFEVDFWKCPIDSSAVQLFHLKETGNGIKNFPKVSGNGSTRLRKQMYILFDCQS